MIGSAVGADRRRVAASVIAAIDQHIADADPAHLAEADFLRGGRHDTVPDLVLELKMAGYLVVHHSDFDVLIPSHSRIGKLSGGTRISMLLGTPG